MLNKKLFHKDFVLVVIGQIISLFGNGIVRFALPLYLLNQTASASLFGLVTALSFLPMILLMPLGGIIADRASKQRIMVVLDFATAAIMLVLFLLLGKVDLVFLLLITLMLLYGIGGAYQPAVQASMPLLQSEKNLLPANAIVNQVSALAGLLSPIIGGIWFSMWGIKPIIAIAAVCFLVSAIMELFITIPHTKTHSKGSVLKTAKKDFADSIAFIKTDRPIILKSVGIICGFNAGLSAMLMVAIPLIITQTLHMSEQLYGYSQGAFAAGALAGGVLVGLFAKKLSMQQMPMLLGLVAILLLPIVICLWLSFLPFASYIIICISCFLIMSVGTMINVQMLTFIQSETPEALCGKVISCTMALAMFSQPLGQGIYGLLFEVFSNTSHFVVLFAAGLSFCFALLSKKVFRHITT